MRIMLPGILVLGLGGCAHLRSDGDDLAHVQAVVVDMPTATRPDLRFIGVAFKNTGDRSMRLVARQHTFAPNPDPAECGEMTGLDFTITLPPKASTMVPILRYDPASGDIGKNWPRNARIGIPVLVDSYDGPCAVPLVWTPNTLATAIR